MNNTKTLRLARTSLGIAALTFCLGTATAQTSSPSSAAPSSGNTGSNYPRDARANTGNSSNDTSSGPASSSRDTTANPRASSSMSTSDNNAAQSTISRSDRKMILKMADDGQKEVKVGQLAADRATDPNVRSYAQQLVTDHTTANTELAALAARKGVTLPAEEKNDRHYTALAEKSGIKFDQGFTSMMTDDHEDAIDLYEKASTKADDADLRAYASKYLPVLRDHEARAKTLEKATSGDKQM